MELSLESAYNSLLADNNQAFVQTIEGTILTLSEFVCKHKPIWQIHVYSGSFNPMHDGHKAIYDRIPPNENLRLFEISINRFDKAPTTLEDLETRLKQFVSYAPVLITNVSKFVEKAGLLAGQPVKYFHIGADTAKRILEHHSIPEIQGMYCSFIIYNRIMDDKILELPEKLPTNFINGPEIPKELMKFSSTAIRAKLGLK